MITINWGILPGAGVEQSNHNGLGASINPARPTPSIVYGCKHNLDGFAGGHWSIYPK